MDLQDPTRSVTPTLDGPVLAVLARAGRPLSVGEVAAETARGSEIGVRRSLARLVEQGIVTAAVMGRNRVHELNREHLAAPVAELLAALRLELWRRLREALSVWDTPPLFAAVFGSAARGDGGSASDIDLLLVHPLLTDEQRSRPTSRRLTALVGERAVSFMTGAVVAEPDAWRRQVDNLRDMVHAWTGNRLQVVDLSVYDWASYRAQRSPLLAEIDRDGIVMTNQFTPAAGTGVGGR
jgi:predicted nucleotidyltransferase